MNLLPMIWEMALWAVLRGALAVVQRVSLELSLSEPERQALIERIEGSLAPR